MSATFRWTCPTSTRGSSVSLTGRRLRAGAQLAPPPAFNSWPPWVRPVHRCESEDGESREQCLHPAGHEPPPFVSRNQVEGRT